MKWQKRLRVPDGAHESRHVALLDPAARPRGSAHGAVRPAAHPPADPPAPMAVYVWQQELDPDFPLAVIEYATQGDRDRMHWHDHLEIALVLEGRGAFLFGRRALPAEAGDVFFIDNSQPHVALPDAGASLRLLLVLFRPELIAGPGSRELDLGYLAPFRVDGRTASARIRGGTALACELAPVLARARRDVGAA